MSQQPTTDVVERLTALNPQLSLDAETRAAVLDAVLASPPHRVAGDHRLAAARPGRRRAVTLSAVVVAAAAVIAAVPAVLPSSAGSEATPAAAAELVRLAAVTAAGPTAGPTQFQHSVTHLVTSFHDTPDVTIRPLSSDYVSEAWVDHDGHAYIRNVQGDGSVLTSLCQDDGQAVFDAYPTSPQLLEQYLRTRSDGYPTPDAAVFFQVANVLRTGVAPPALRSAALQVAAITPHVRLGPVTVDAQGRQVEEFDFVDEQHAPGTVQALVVDTRSAIETAYRNTADYGVMSSQVAVQDVVDFVPPDVVTAAGAMRSCG